MRALLLIATLAFAPAAAAQEPDERAAARGYADAAARFTDALEEPLAAVQRAFDLRRTACGPLSRFPRSRRRGALVISVRHHNRVFARRVAAPLFRFRSELANIPTRDAALISGRAVWRQSGRLLETVRAPGRLCPELRAWRRAGYPRSKVRAAERELEALQQRRRSAAKLRAAVHRLIELGVPDGDADLFENPYRGDSTIVSGGR